MVKILLRTVLLLSVFACSSAQQPTNERLDNHSTSMNYTPLPLEHWLSRATVSEFANLPWNTKKGLKADKAPDVLGAFVKPAQVNWPVVALQPLAKGALLVKGISEVLRINADGTVASRFPLPKGGADNFILTADGELLISQQMPNQPPRLIKISKAGKQVWNREGDAYAVNQLLAQGDKIYLVKKGKSDSQLYPLDLKTGDLGEIFTTLPTIQSVFAGNGNEICFVTYNPQENARYWNQQSPGKDASQTRIPNEMYGTFAFPAATDDLSNAYGAFGSKLAKLSTDGAPGFTMEFEGMARGEDGNHYFSQFNSEAKILKLMRKNTAGEASFAEVTVPDWISKAHNNPFWRLIRVKGGIYHLLGRDPQSYVWHHLLYDGRVGSFIVQDQPGDLSGMGEFASAAGNWGVMRDGSVVLPVRDEKSLRLVRLGW
jgi:hypothetical protein